MDERTASEISREIGEALSPSAQAFWGSCDPEVIEAAVHLGRTQGIEAAARVIEDVSRRLI